METCFISVQIIIWVIIRGMNMEEKILEILDYVKKDNLKVGASLTEILEELFNWRNY